MVIGRLTYCSMLGGLRTLGYPKLMLNNENGEEREKKKEGTEKDRKNNN